MADRLTLMTVWLAGFAAGQEADEAITFDEWFARLKEDVSNAQPRRGEASNPGSVSAVPEDVTEEKR